MSAAYHCCDPGRLNAVRAHNDRVPATEALTAVASLEVVDTDYLDMGLPPATAGALRQRTLLVRCLRAVHGLAAAQVRILGGERITPVRVLWAQPADSLSAPPALPAERARFADLPAPEQVLVVRTDRAGDFSRYRLELINSPADPTPHAAFDPRLHGVDFGFRVECPADFDCREALACEAAPRPAPAINYLAKDYESLRRTLLERLAQLLPDWQPRSPADLGVTLVEWLAYVGDYLSYRQDAVATEAYLATCRRRVSLRRHARLMDYAVSEGCNARVWLQIAVDADVAAAAGGGPALPAGTRALTRIDGLPGRIADASPWLERADAVFETLHDVPALVRAHDTLHFHTWGERECCLPAGATAATLAGHFAALRVGEVLILEELLSPVTGEPADRDVARRHPVRLTTVAAIDGTGAPLRDPVSRQPITEIRWDDGDALPFALVLSARTTAGHGHRYVTGVSVARGNVVLADHGRTVAEEPLGEVPQPTLAVATGATEGCAGPVDQTLPARFRPRLAQAPLTHHSAVDPAVPAARSLGQDPGEVLPAVRLWAREGADSTPWAPRRDLLGSGPLAREFVAEIDSDGHARIRFGDGRHGRRPTAGLGFTATYRVGNGASGNVGAEAVAHIEAADSAIVGIRNPLPAAGGTDPEAATRIRDRVPFAYRTQERAVTEADWGAVAVRDAAIGRAAARLRWTGSWHTAFVAVDRRGGLAVSEDFANRTRRHLERYRMAGGDLRVEEGRTVPLEVTLEVCVAPDRFRGEVRAELLRRLSNRVLPDGQLGVFHPDRFSFGEPVYLSRLYAAAQAVPGVESVRITTFRRLGSLDTAGLETGRLGMGPFEIARLDNDPNFPERGVLRVQLGGGK